MGKESFRSLRFHLRMWRVVQKKNREIRKRDEIIRDLRRRIFFSEYKDAVVEEIEAKGVLPRGRTRRAGL